MSFDDRIKREINDLHAFFEGWLGGTLEGDADAFRRLESALGDGFVLVTPSGEELERAPLLATLRDAFGARPRVRIWIERPRLLHHASPIAVARYEELQESAGNSTRRLSTAVFRESDDAPDSTSFAVQVKLFTLGNQDNAAR